MFKASCVCTIVFSNFSHQKTNSDRKEWINFTAIVLAALIAATGAIVAAFGPSQGSTPTPAPITMTIVVVHSPEHGRAPSVHKNRKQPSKHRTSKATNGIDCSWKGRSDTQ
jgi:hypothetical protein